MNDIFQITYDTLMWISSVTGLSYKAVNVVVWFFIIPLTWAILGDLILRRHWLRIAVITAGGLSLLLLEFEAMAVWTFDRSVEFLNAFNSIGIGYVSASVLICLLIPIIIYITLILLVYRRRNAPPI